MFEMANNRMKRPRAFVIFHALLTVSVTKIVKKAAVVALKMSLRPHFGSCHNVKDGTHGL